MTKAPQLMSNSTTPKTFGIFDSDPIAELDQIMTDAGFKVKPYHKKAKSVTYAPPTPDWEKEFDEKFSSENTREDAFFLWEQDVKTFIRQTLASERKKIDQEWTNHYETDIEFEHQKGYEKGVAVEKNRLVAEVEKMKNKTQTPPLNEILHFAGYIQALQDVLALIKGEKI